MYGTYDDDDLGRVRVPCYDEDTGANHPESDLLDDRNFDIGIDEEYQEHARQRHERRE